MPVQLSNHLSQENYHRMTDGRDVVFATQFGIHEVIERRKNMPPYVLVSHGWDVLIDEKYAGLITDNIVAWYATNVAINHDKVHPIPLGLADRKWPHGEYENLINHKNHPKPKWVHACFAVETNPRQRRPAAEWAKKQWYVTAQSYDSRFNAIPHDEYCRCVADHKFVMSPPGNGVDCHRTWEALYMGRRPICLRSPVMEKLAEIAPILLVDSWDEITIDWLWQNIEEPDYDKSVLTVDYWRERFYSHVKH